MYLIKTQIQRENMQGSQVTVKGKLSVWSPSEANENLSFRSAKSSVKFGTCLYFFSKNPYFFATPNDFGTHGSILLKSLLFHPQSQIYLGNR